MYKEGDTPQVRVLQEACMQHFVTIKQLYRNLRFLVREVFGTNVQKKNVSGNRSEEKSIIAIFILRTWLTNPYC